MGRSAFAWSKFLAAIAFLNSFTASRYSRFLRSFNDFFRFDCLKAFLAEDVIGIDASYHSSLELQDLFPKPEGFFKLQIVHGAFHVFGQAPDTLGDR